MRINVKLLNRSQPMMDPAPGGPPPAALSFPLLIDRLARQLAQSAAASVPPAIPPAGPAPPGTG